MATPMAPTIAAVSSTTPVTIAASSIFRNSHRPNPDPSVTLWELEVGGWVLSRFQNAFPMKGSIRPKYITPTHERIAVAATAFTRRGAS